MGKLTDEQMLENIELRGVFFRKWRLAKCKRGEHRSVKVQINNFNRVNHIEVPTQYKDVCYFCGNEL